ncbi:MAG: SusD/RagB family nutrient-binding outer membrane lipoprotein [Prevotellaceae bacterium]|nr:SusD/RagB family nutrient-binding outer membrane lipoprotein [Prevotellaceae bacterium]
MKIKIYKYLFAFTIALLSFSCQDLENVNTDPNNPAKVPSNMLFGGAQKKIMDYVYDVWFSGRQSLVYAQYWGQRNYTEEDRYQIRESVNNSYFNVFYTLIHNLDEVIELNTNPETAPISAVYGNNNNQIAAAKVLKVWLYSVITDTWGNVPYVEVGKLEDGLYYPKYDDQKTIYDELIKELTEAADMIDESEIAFVGGDRIYAGDASKWKKFANSLKIRLALHTSKVTGSKWKDYIAEALASGVFESNDDVAAYHYSTSPEHCYFYEGFFVEARNDFTLTRSFIDILKGQPDTLNSKSHPWTAVVDPRLSIYTTPRNGQYIGIPYGIPSSNMTAAFRNLAPNIYSAPPLVLTPDFPVPLLTYAEVQFIISEYNGFSAPEYVEGVTASLEYWAGLDGVALSQSDVDDYVDAVSQSVDAEAVALQKYIDLYMNGMEAWTEIRRTGYPEQLLLPNEISTKSAAGANLLFTTLSDTKGLIVARVKYPTNESTLNKANFEEAVSKLEDGTNNYYTPMFWDKRRTEGQHPVNK